MAEIQSAPTQPQPAVSSAVPLQVEATAPTTNPKGARFDYGTEYRDPFWLGVFLVQLIIMIAMTAAYGQKTVDLFNAAPSSGPYPGRDPWSQVLLPLVIVAACVAVGFSFVWIYFMKRCGGAMIIASFVIMAVLLIVTGIYAAKIGLVNYGVLMWVIAGLMVIYLYFVRNRIPFTKAVMMASSQALNDFPSSIWISYAMSVLHVAYFCFWVFGVISIIVGTQSLTGLAVFFFFLNLYWSAQVLANVSHTTTAGMVGSWWFQPNAPSPTSAAFKRATTTSLGTIALGSLIVALIRALNSTLRCLCACGCYRCIGNYMQKIIRYFNVYTFSYVAIYGQPFLQSAECTIRLFSQKGFTAIVNDSLVGVVLYVGSLIGGAIGALIGLAWCKGEAAHGLNYYLPDISNDSDVGPYFQFLFILCAFFAAFSMTALSMTVFESAVATTFIVWADDAPALAGNRPIHFAALQEGASKMYGPSGPTYVMISGVVGGPVGGDGGVPGQPAYTSPPAGATGAAPPSYGVVVTAQPPVGYAQPVYAAPAYNTAPVAAVVVGVPVASAPSVGTTATIN